MLVEFPAKRKVEFIIELNGLRTPSPARSKQPRFQRPTWFSAGVNLMPHLTRMIFFTQTFPLPAGICEQRGMKKNGESARGGRNKNCVTFKAENTRTMLIDNFMHFGFQFHMRTLVRSRWLHRSNSGIPKATFSEPIPEHVVPSFIFSSSFATLLYTFTKFPLHSDGRAKFPSAVRTKRYRALFRRGC